MVVFVSGHHDLKQEDFDKYYAPKIKNLVENDKNISFVVGFYSGCDIMFLDYIESNFINLNITIYVATKETHILYLFTNILSDLNTRLLDTHNNLRICYRNTYEDCDKEMSEVSNMDLAFIYSDRENSHTAKNILRRYLML